MVNFDLQICSRGKPINNRVSSGSITTIKPVSSWQWPDVLELFKYRELFLAFCMRDIKVRYKQTVLGAMWAIIQPVTIMIIFSIIFGGLAKIPSEGYPYPIFLYSALLPWNLFASVVATAGGSMISSAALVGKIYFPRMVVPYSSAGAACVDFLISSCVLLVLMWYFDVSLGWGLLVVPLLMFGVLLTALGVGTALAALVVSYRDFRFVIPFLVQIWMYLTPVVYPLNFIPDQWRWILLINPMTGYVDGFRSAYLGVPLNLTSLIISIVLSVALFCLGAIYFKKVEKRFADVI